MAAGALAIAQLIAQLLPVAVNAYKEIQQANQSSLPPVETILASADANWDQIAATAQAQLSNKPTGGPDPSPTPTS